MKSATGAGEATALLDEAKRLSFIDPTGSLKLAERALRLAERGGDERTIAWAHYRMAAARNNTADYVAAMADARRALQLFGRLGDGAGEGVALWQTAVAYIWLGRPPRALELCAHALKKLSGPSQAGNRAAVINTMGLARYLLGDLEGAEYQFEQAIAVPEFAGNAPLYISSLNNLGIIAMMLGNQREAMVRYKRALECAEKAGLKQRMAEALTNIGGVHDEAGELGKSRVAQARALAIARECGARRPELIAIISLGDIDLAEGKPAEAERRYREALAIAQAARQPYGIAQARIGLGNLMLRGDRVEEARKVLGEALALLEESGDKQLEVVVLQLLAECWERGGKPAFAARERSRARRIQRLMRAAAKRRTIWLDKLNKMLPRAIRKKAAPGPRSPDHLSHQV